MVALLTADPIYSFPTPQSRRSRLRHLHAVPTPPAVAPGADQSPRRAERTESRSVTVPTEVLAGLIVVLLGIMVVASFRAVQGVPDASWTTAVPAEVVPASAAEQVITVQPGDTLWGIAAAIAPQADRRVVVQQLAERNGGSTIWAGQDLIIPPLGSDR